MRTTVVNLHREAYDVYIGRAGRGHDGYFGNPYRAGEVCGLCRRVHRDRGSTIPCFERYFRGRVESDPAFRVRVEQLRGRRLGCFCKPNKCHGDVIASWLDGEEAI